MNTLPRSREAARRAGLGPLRHVASTGSTNDDLAAEARRGGTAPAVLVADRQTAGRGRLGRRWIDSGRGRAGEVALLVSLRLPGPLDTAQDRVAAVSAAALAACARALAPTGRSPKSKWPNDLVIESDWVVGSELGIRSDRVVGSDWVVGSELGIGSDRVVGSELGFGSDRVVGSELGFGSDRVVGSELGFGSDRVVGSELGFGSDRVVGSELGFGSDRVVGSELGFGSDRVVGSDRRVVSDLVVGSGRVVASDRAIEPDPVSGKLAGVLAELVAGDPGVVVVGLGVNLAPVPSVPAAVSLAEAGAVVARDDLLAAMLEALPAHLCDPAGARAALRSASATLGRRVRVERADGMPLVGLARDIDESGCLVVAVDGAEHRIDAGDVIHLRPL